MLEKSIKGNYKFPNSEREKQLVSFMSPKECNCNLPSKMVQIERISCVQFVIEGTRRNSTEQLSVTAYTNNNGTAVKILCREFPEYSMSHLRKRRVNTFGRSNM